MRVKKNIFPISIITFSLIVALAGYLSLKYYHRKKGFTCHQFKYSGKPIDCGFVKKIDNFNQENGYQLERYIFLGKLIELTKDSDGRAYIVAQTKNKRGKVIREKLYLAQGGDLVIVEKRISNDLAHGAREEYLQIHPSELLDKIGLGDEFEFSLRKLTVEDKTKFKKLPNYQKWSESYEKKCELINKRFINYLIDSNLKNFIVYKLDKLVRDNCYPQVFQISYYE